VLYIYANIPNPILSCGVKVTYDPADLGNPVAEKNEDVWFMGDGTDNHPYMDPEVNGDNVVVILGKLDTADPQAGVSGDRVYLGKIVFDRLSANVPAVTLEFGRDGEFKNFVRTDSTVLDDEVDGVSFSAKVAEKGDANADGSVNAVDAQFVSQIFFGSLPWSVFADCNGDGNVNAVDAQCISAKFFGTW
jgi:hypothetical protein